VTVSYMYIRCSARIRDGIPLGRGGRGGGSIIPYLFEEGVGLEPDFRAFFRLKSVTELLGTF
jgi:hypothetical protein